MHQRERRGVAHRDPVDVGDRQREARALQQRAEIAQIGKRRDARRHAALDLGLGFGECGPQLGETFAADHGCKEQPVRLERAADLDERARQIVDELQGERGDDEIERSVAKRQRLFIGDARPAIVPTRLARSPRRTASVGVPRSTAISKVRSTADRRSAISSATRSSRNVAGPIAAARARRARSKRRSKITGCGIGLL